MLLFPVYTDMCWLKWYEPEMISKNLKLAIFSLNCLSSLLGSRLDAIFQQFNMDVCMGMNRV